MLFSFFATSLIFLFPCSDFNWPVLPSHLIFGVPLSKLYTNSLMSSLNARGGWKFSQRSGEPHFFNGDATRVQSVCILFHIFVHALMFFLPQGNVLLITRPEVCFLIVVSHWSITDNVLTQVFESDEMADVERGKSLNHHLVSEAESERQYSHKLWESEDMRLGSVDSMVSAKDKPTKRWKELQAWIHGTICRQ